MNDGDPRIEVMILGYNCKEDALRCLESVSNQEYDRYAVTYVDNGSEDGSVEAVRNAFPEVRIVSHDRNHGFATGYNLAIEDAVAPYVALLNPDTMAPRNWLAAYARTIENSPDDVAIWGGKVVIEGTDAVHHAGTKITPIGSGLNPHLWTRRRSERENRPTAAGCGANMLIDVERFREIGGFDDDYFMYFEDVDVGWRAWLEGYRVEYVPVAVVEHALGGVVKAQSPFHSPFRCYYGTRNRIWTAMKNFPLPRVFLALAIGAVYDLILVGQAAATRNTAVVRSIAAAYASAFRSLPAVARKRVRIQRNRVRDHRELADGGIFISFRDSVRAFRRLYRRYSRERKR